MREKRIIPQPGRLAWFSALSAALCFCGLGLFAAPILHAGDPPGDCWRGVLSDTPLQCYALEAAQRDGLIDVEAVYAAGEVLYFQLSQEDPLGDTLGQFLIDKGRQYAGGHSGTEWCPHHGKLGTEGCIEFTFTSSDIYLGSGPYRSVTLRHGGEDSRRDQGGWASWRQLWPQRMSSAQRRTSGGGPFDVSEVDLANFPELHCHTHATMGCDRAESYPGLGIAGWRHDFHHTYIQLKAEPGQEAEAEAALRDALIRKFGPGGDGGDRIVIIPVKYSYEELWRWSEVLNRFARSPGNTIGIAGAHVSTNSPGHDDDAIYPLESLQPAPSSHDLPTGVSRQSFLRETIRVSAWDMKLVADALPHLLSQLKIPLDAVGVITQTSLPYPSLLVYDADDQRTGGDLTGSSGSGGSATNARVSVWIITGLVAALTVAGAALTLALRRRG